MSGSSVFAALILARALAGPEPHPIPEPESHPRPLAERVLHEPEPVRDAPPKSYAPRMTAT